MKIMLSVKCGNKVRFGSSETAKCFSLVYYFFIYKVLKKYSKIISLVIICGCSYSENWERREYNILSFLYKLYFRQLDSI